MRRYRLYCSWLIMFLAVASVLAAGRPYTPKPGDPERKAIMDTLRAPVEKELKRKVVFKVDHLKVQGGWAFMIGVPLQPNGKPMDYRGTIHEAAIENGAFDDWICALLKKKDGKWTVLKYVIGATDVAYYGWNEEYKAPKEIFPAIPK